MQSPSNVGGDDAFSFDTVEESDVRTYNQTLRLGAIHLHDFGSETYDFMDVPDIIQLEPGTGMRKQDVNHFSKLENKAAADGLPEYINQNSSSQASTSGLILLGRLINVDINMQ